MRDRRVYKEKEEKGVDINGGRARGRRRKGLNSFRRNLSDQEPKRK